jgi:hypothetical protein
MYAPHSVIGLPEGTPVDLAAIRGVDDPEARRAVLAPGSLRAAIRAW